MTAQVFDSRICALGEGPLWHPLRKQLFWFDILGKRLLTREAGKARHWSFQTHVSAAGWLGRDALLIASENGLFRFDLRDGAQRPVVALEADQPETRSNDGRADPWGGFWISTMGKKAEPGLGAIYRYHRGEMRRLSAPMTIPNAICFAPDKSCAYFADTADRRILRQPLARDTGWPVGRATPFVDLRAEGMNPDGAVIDAQGCLWNAQWGASRVACYSPAGVFLRAVALPAAQVSCPAFGGGDLSTLFATTGAKSARGRHAGQTFAVRPGVVGLPECRVIP